MEVLLMKLLCDSLKKNRDNQQQEQTKEYIEKQKDRYNYEEKETTSSFLSIDDEELKQILREAKHHELHTLIYPVLKNLQRESPELTQYRQHVLSSITLQINNNEKVREIFKKFSESNISFLPLKGVVIRELYPYPELRTMGDTDIIVERADMERASEILLSEGYIYVSCNGKHISYSHPIYLDIELHYNLISSERLPYYSEDYEAEVFKNKVQATLCDTRVYIPCPEDHIIFMLLHMASHIIATGFGIRQLTDLYILIEHYKKTLNWNYINLKLREFKIEKFSRVVFLILKNNFNLELPLYKEVNEEDIKLYNDLLMDILGSGNLGFKEKERNIIFLKQHYNPNKKNSNILSFIFPSAKTLSSKYNYLEKHKLLLPFAWFHRIIGGVLRRDFTLKEKSFLVFSKESSSKLLLDRTKLLHSLDL